MKHLTYFVICLTIVDYITCFGGVPRGVAPERLSLYNPMKDFTCLDGSLTIPFSFVNDDYCDCIDGSDEPGTPACPNGYFYCYNKGYIERYIPSSRVEDTICDCCDGSDEYGKKNCTNTCDQLGIQARREAERVSLLVNAGLKLRFKMVAMAKEILQEKEKRLIALRLETNEATIVKNNAEAKKKSAEAKEAEALEVVRAQEEQDAAKAHVTQEEEEQTGEVENLITSDGLPKPEGVLAPENTERNGKDLETANQYFTTCDLNKDGILQRNEVPKARDIFDIDNDGFVSSEEIKYFIADDQEIALDDFELKVWPKLKPLILRRKVDSKPKHWLNPEFEDELKEAQMFQDQTQRLKDQAELLKSEGPLLEFELELKRKALHKLGEEKHEEYTDDEESDDTDNEYNNNDSDSENEESENEDSENGESETEDSDNEEEEEEEEGGPPPNSEIEGENSNPKYSPEVLSLIEDANEARSQFEAAQKTVQDLEREQSQIQDTLAKDYGTDHEFAPLDGQCLTYTDRSYSYKLCPFQQVIQMPKSGGSEISLGTWAGWGGRGKHAIMMYNKGQACWNGPQRSTKVVVNCGLENEVVSVNEPNKCEYVMIFTSPAACRSFSPNKDPHDEL